MLFRKATLEAIAAGKVRCAFRRWRRPTVKTGGTLRTAVGLLRVERVTPVDPAEISEDDARRAGYGSKRLLVDELNAHTAGTVYRIDLHREGPDPREALRERAALSPAECAALRAKLDRFDAGSPHGPWTRRTLAVIAAAPCRPAADLARQLHVPRDWLKLRVRQLKDLGLTESRNTGYSLSPRGRSVLAAFGSAAVR